MAVDVSTEGKVSTITINRPERRNALSGAVIEGLIEAFATVAEDDSVVAVITGAGEKCFCAGGDISDFQADAGLLGLHHQRGRFADLMIAMNRSPKPIIARVNGHALGGGFGLMLNCDLVVASDTAKLGTPEIKLGLFPMMIMAILDRNLGRKTTMELMLTGERISAEAALEIGAVNRVVAPDELDGAVAELAGKVASYSPAILRLGRSAFYKTQDMAFEDAIRSLHNELTLNVLSEDAAEGVMAFLSKREPEWRGR